MHNPITIPLATGRKFICLHYPLTPLSFARIGGIVIRLWCWYRSAIGFWKHLSWGGLLYIYDVTALQRWQPYWKEHCLPPCLKSQNSTVDPLIFYLTLCGKCIYPLGTASLQLLKWQSSQRELISHGCFWSCKEFSDDFKTIIDSSSDSGEHSLATTHELRIWARLWGPSPLYHPLATPEAS